MNEEWSQMAANAVAHWAEMAANAVAHWAEMAANAVAHWAEMAAENIRCVTASYERPAVLFKPRLFIDGNQWCALYGDNLQDGVAGFGCSPEAAMRDFDKNWCSVKGGAA